MKEFIRILRMTTVGGALSLAPFIVLIIILGKAIQILRVATVPIAEHIPIESAVGLETPRMTKYEVLNKTSSFDCSSFVIRKSLFNSYAIICNHDQKRL